MNETAVAAAALLAAAGLSELVLRGMKLQTGLVRIVAAWALPYAAAAGWSVRHDASVIVLTIFWIGAFLAWFGIRSHLESSIALRMIYRLRERPMREGELIDAYLSTQSESMRLAELRRAGLIAAGAGAMCVTPKGKLVLRLTSLLR